MTATAENHVFMLPDLGEGLTEAEIVEWRVALGDTVELDQVVVEVETAKAVVDVPCPYAGRVVALHGAPGETRPVGQPLITVQPLTGASVAAGGPAAAAGPADPAEPAAHATYREEERAGSGNVLIGYGTGHGQAGGRRRRVAASHARGDREPAVVGPAAEAPADPVTLARRAGSAPLVISPLVRRLARERGVDVTAIRGTGPGGIVRRSDVEAALVGAAHRGSPGKGEVPALPSFLAGASPPRSPGKGAVPAEPALPSSLVGASVDEVVIPLRGVRRVIADKLSRSRREIPEVTIWVDVDATGLMETRATINAARPDRPVSVLALLARICVHALQRFPELNARVDLEREQIIQSSRVNLGVAAQTDRGLVVPVIQDAQRLNTADLAAALADTTAEARAGTLPPARLAGGTFTLNNYGVFGVDGSTPIINHPEAALLGLGRIVDKPWVVDGQLAVRKVAQISLTFDHRVCDGGVAGGFLRYVADCVERPALLIANL